MCHRPALNLAFPPRILPRANYVPCVNPCDNAVLFPGAAVTKHHRLGGLEQHRCIVSALEAGRQRWVCQQGMVSDKGCLEESAPDPPLGSWCHPVLRVPWPGDTPLQSGIRCHMASSPWVRPHVASLPIFLCILF